MRSKSYLFLLLVLGLGILSAVLFTKTTANYGLDVKGGIRLTYQMQLNAKQHENVDDIRQRLIRILVRRASGSLGVAEAPVTAKGDDEVSVELPGYSDLDAAKKIIGTSAKIQFFWAKNVVTSKPASEYRAAYSVFYGFKKEDSPTVNFENKITGKIVKFNDPEYQRIIDGWQPILSGDELKSASVQVQGNNDEPYMQFSPEGADKMSKWSTKLIATKGEEPLRLCQPTAIESSASPSVVA